MLKVNSSDSTFNNFIWAYNSYQQYKFLHETGDPATLDRQIEISNDIDAIPVFSFHESEKIHNSLHPTVIVNSGEEGSYIFDFLGAKPFPTDKKVIFFSDSNFKLVDREKYNCLPIVWHWFLLEQFTAIASNRHIASFVDLTRDFTKTRKFNFCSLVGFARPLRDTLVNKLISNLSNRNFVLQYNGNTLGQEPIGDIKYKFSNYNSYQKYDILNAQNEHFTISKSIPIELYNNSNFMLVVECLLHDNYDTHITEKITKALITGIPFIVVSSSNYLTQLRELGFRTYNSLWDESYDTITPAEDRFDAIVDLINQLDSFDWIANADKLEAIANHNKLNFFNLNKTMIAAFEQFDKYIYDVL